ncbi:MAG: GTPase HflX [Clostridia bacterium]|nr:GTPase HflX [Clostridia bacterium]
MEFDKGELLPIELTLKMAELTYKTNREIAVYINRKGNIIEVSVGDSGTVSLPQVDGRKAKNRLSGIRCVHTHPNGDGRLSSVDISSLLNLRLDAMMAIGVKDGNVTDIYAAVPIADENGDLAKADIYGPFHPGSSQLQSIFSVIKERDKSSSAVFYLQDIEERAILVGLETRSGRMIGGKSEGERLLDELEELARTAGVNIVHKILQKRAVQDSAFYIGKGMAEQIGLLRQALNANVVIFDDELSGAQVRNLEEVVGVKVIDRNTLILDIFAQRARSSEGKIQVELAQLKYRLPRLIGLGNQLSRLGGGIGTRGPGEKKLEVDRRHIKRRIGFLESELRNISSRRGMLRESRKKNQVPTIALVGYTNVGKSTLMNAVCKSDVLAEDKLFATLDPTTRKLELPNGREVLFIDTVGFIRKLPHELIEAFKSTLEEAVFADLLMHVVDVSSEEIEEQMAVVYDILNGLGALNKPVILVLNKVDLVQGSLIMPAVKKEDRVFEVSAATGMGIDSLLKGISEMLSFDEVEISLLVPYSEGWVVPYLHENGKVLQSEYKDTGVCLTAIVKKIKTDKIRNFIISLK